MQELSARGEGVAGGGEGGEDVVAMAGPLVFWPNRKSKHGLQKSAKTPRAHRKPFATEPPIMKFKPLLLPKKYDSYACLDDSELIESFKDDLAAKLPAYSDVLDLMLKLLNAQKEQIDVHKKKDELHKDVMKALDEAETELRRLELVEREHEKLKIECDAKTADLRKLRDQLDEDKIQLRILYAVDEACASRDSDIKSLRSELVERDSRIAELERSKKKLREALSRLSENT